MLKTFKNLADMQYAFPDENACINHFRAVRWPEVDKMVCPRCGVSGTHYTLADNTHKCRDCRRKFTVRNGTIFEDSKIALRKWFIAIFLMTAHKKGISSCQLARDIGVTQKTAWFMLHRIRNAAIRKEFNAPLAGTIEMDEACVGGNSNFMHASKKPNLVGMAAACEKKIMVGMLQRDGELRLHHVGDTRKKTMRPLIEANIRRGAQVHIDDNRIYDWMRSRYAHSAVRHSLGE